MYYDLNIRDYRKALRPDPARKRREAEAAKRRQEAVHGRDKEIKALERDYMKALAAIDALQGFINEHDFFKKGDFEKLQFYWVKKAIKRDPEKVRGLLAEYDQQQKVKPK